MLQYIILNNTLEKLVPGDEILFYLPSGKTYRGQISLGNTGYYCFLSNIDNARIFEELEIYDANDFVKRIVGYDCKGDWPEVKTLDDFVKIIEALDDECIKKWGIPHNSTEPNRNTSQLKVGDKVKILPRNSSQEDYYPQYVDGMLKYVGQLATITQVMKTSCNIDLDDSSYYWPFNALQLVTSEIGETVDPHKLKNGDYIKITSHLLKDLSLIYIFKEIKNKSIYRHVSYNIESKTIDVNSKTWWLFENNTEITYATEEESKLLDEALLKEGYRWNSLTKQLDSIGIVDISTNGLTYQPADVSSFYNSIQKAMDTITGTINWKKEEIQTETGLNLFPKKKHYQLNFNY